MQTDKIWENMQHTPTLLLASSKPMPSIQTCSNPPCPDFTSCTGNSPPSSGPEKWYVLFQRFDFSFSCHPQSLLQIFISKKQRVKT